MPIHIGLIGATAIAERAMVGPGRTHAGVRMAAIAAGDPDRARAFAARNGIPHVAEDYAGLVADPGLDAVYVSLHNSAHHEWALRAAAAGKHVVVEKPICLDTGEWTAIAAAATLAGVHVREAVPTAGHPWQAAIAEMVADRRYGELTAVETRMCFAEPAPGSYRDRPELGGGIFLDVASYWLQALQVTVGLSGVTATGEVLDRGPYGADRAFRARLEWPGGAAARLSGAVGGRHASEHVFVFARARVRLRDFLRPTAGALPLNLVITGHDGAKEIRTFAATSYYTDQLDRICRQFGTRGPDRADLAATAERVALTALLRPDHREARL